MGKVKVENKPFSKTFYYSGVYTTDASDDLDEYRQGNFEFTVLHTVDHASGTFNTEVEWVEEPSNVDLAVEQVMNSFYAAIGIE